MDSQLHIVYHGSSFPPGTSSTHLRKPTLEQPLFVADAPYMARYYMDTYKDDGSSNNPSIYVFVLKEDPVKTAFDFNNESHLSKLKPRFPSLVKLLEFRKGYSFFSTVEFMTEVLTNLFLVMRMDGTTEFRKKTIRDINDQYTREVVRLAVKSLANVGFIEMDPVTKEIICSDEAEKVIKSHMATLEMDKFIRRAIKAKIFKVIYDAGFKLFVDKDTTPHNAEGLEFGIFDMSVIEEGTNISVKSNQIDDVVSQLWWDRKRRIS